ncbi:MAG: sugar phosphate isomerase/epimerase [Clostridia bacterium]|nr:sugar phosphate isomerase/epimerase [Clostridia bacterium]
MEFGMPTLIEFDTVEENASLARELRLDFIELNMNLPQYQIGAIDADRLKSLSEKYSVFYSIHLDENLDPCDFNDRVADAYMQTVKDTVAFAKQLDIKILNMHLSKGVYFTLPDRKVFLFDKYNDVYMKKIAAFRDFCDAEIGESDIKICIENSSGYLAFHKDAIEELLKSEVFGLTWDIGHDHCAGKDDGKFILEHRDRLCHMHIHDAINSRYRKQNHLALGEGELDIDKYLAFAEERGCTVVFETKTADALRKSIGYIKEGKL